ncbi:MAG: hypothetical protein K9W44_06100 [Candidatus Lokiarchaeota archaeon]|nr:hypothetical protein [Candidatus Harpocratesius repetitus]
MVDEYKPNLHFIFHEQWLGISVLCDLSENEISKNLQEMEQFVNDVFLKITIDKINPTYVPDIKDREKIVSIAHNLKCSFEWQNYIEDFRYVHSNHTYNKLGYILIRVRLKENISPDFDLRIIRPQYLQQIVFSFWFGLIKKFQNHFLFDEKTVPYAFNVCSEVDPRDLLTIEWNPHNIQKYKREIGDWCVLYSGQFPDYHDLLYERRVEVNLSNRSSEMHFIHRNSAFLYMRPENYNKFFIKDNETPNSTGYMFNTVIKTVCQMRTIGFAMILVNSEIDIDTSQLTSRDFKEKDPGLIKDDLEKTTRLKMILQRTLAPFFTDLSRSHRQHYHTLLQHCVNLYNIEKNWKMISDKLESNTQELNSLFLDKQEEASKRQEKILNIVNLILGAGIVFEIVDFIVDDTDLQSLIKKIVGGGFLLLIIGLLVPLYLPKLFKKFKRKKSK